MDSQQFRTITAPNYYAGATSRNVSKVETQIASPSVGLNSRYPGYAAITQDANIFTDYRPKCEKNIPYGQQFATRQWLQHNAENIIITSRERQARATGANYMNASTVPPVVAKVQCDIKSCSYYPATNLMTGNKIPTGVSRVDEAPPLFGTFEFREGKLFDRTPPTMTTRYEGGRNTPRN